MPLENAYFEEFYEEMIQFIRSVFESALKSNPALEFAVITGCLQISKESIFTGLNNLKIYSVLNEQYGNAFGFTQEEVDTLLRDYDLGQKRKEVGYGTMDTSLEILKYITRGASSTMWTIRGRCYKHTGQIRHQTASSENWWKKQTQKPDGN